MKQYMVDFKLPSEMNREFVALIPYQRAIVNQFLSEGKLVSYALALESSRLWAVFNAESEEALLEMVQELPLTEFMRYKIHVLTFHNAVNAAIPEFSLN